MSSSVIVTNLDDEFDGEEEMETTRSRKTKTKGRGFGGSSFEDDRYSGKSGKFDSVNHDGAEARASGAQKSVEGWILFVRNVHEEAQEDDIYDLFADYGEIKQIHLNLDRRTGYVKGYAMIEYEMFKEAQNAIESLNGHSLLDQEISVDWAFKAAAKKGGKGGRRRGRD